MRIFPTINLHLTAKCNYSCKFCFAHFNGVKRSLISKDKENLVRIICEQPEIKKINFVGGEPTLIPELKDLLRIAHSFNKTTSLTTNGSLINPEWVQEYSPFLDIISISIDSDNLNTNIASGRCDKHGHSLGPEHHYRISKACHENGITLKVNTVVSRFNVNERITDYVNRLNPKRWKVFQALKVTGENSELSSQYEIDDNEYKSYIQRNRKGLKSSIIMIVEDNELMRGSYLMVNPEGCFFDNTQGHYTVSEPILSLGFNNAIGQVEGDYPKFVLRGGDYSVDNDDN